MVKPKMLEEVIEGTGAELAEQLRQPERIHKRFRAFLMQEESLASREEEHAELRPVAERPSILGKYAGRAPSTEEFLREKHKETAREDGQSE